MVYPVAKRVVLPLFNLFFRDIKGVENIPKKGPFIITANHDSWLDGPMILSVVIVRTNRKVHSVALKGRLWKFFGDSVAKQWGGVIPLNEGKKKAFQKMLSLLKRGKILINFIEGPHEMDGKLHKAKTGVIRLALGSHAPILPMGIIGTDTITPKNRMMPKFKRAKLNIGKLIYLDKYYDKKIDYKLLTKLTNDVMEVISDLTGKPYNY
jgi:1-acyl-sn-glycerol-3-phosphate acyltransferase